MEVGIVCWGVARREGHCVIIYTLAVFRTRFGFKFKVPEPRLTLEYGWVFLALKHGSCLSVVVAQVAYLLLRELSAISSISIQLTE